MDSLLVVFILTCSSSLLWHQLPPPIFILVMTVGVAGLCYRNKSKIIRYSVISKAISAVVGIAWMASVGYWDTYWQLPEQHYQQTVTVSGQVKTLLSIKGDIRFNLQINAIDDESYPWIQPLVRLSWRDSDSLLQYGQSVTLKVKLKPPRGLANEHGFNYQQWLFANRIVATGYVKSSILKHAPSSSPIYAPHHQVDYQEISFRQLLLNRILTMDLRNESWILALAIGHRELFEKSDWTLLQQTGTAHLVAISGLHIGMVAAGAYFIVGLLCSVFFNVIGKHNSVNCHRVALFVSVIVAIGYAWLSGLALPTLRALIMLIIIWLLALYKWHWSLKRGVLVSMSVIIILFPFSIFTLSYWLSFSAVWFIGLIFWRWPVQGDTFSFIQGMRGAVRIQLGISILMLPFIAWQMGVMSVSAPIVNIVAVPFMSFILLPLTLLATLFSLLGSPLDEFVFMVCDNLFDWFVYSLQLAQSVSYSFLTIPKFDGLSWLGILGFVILWLMPPIPFPKYMMFILLLPCLSEIYSATKSWKIDVLDVGQGLSVLVSQNEHTVLYDTGPAYPSGFNMADAVIVPLLKGRGIKVLDRVIVSHSDVDHSGSLASLIKQIPVTKTLTSEDDCFVGDLQQWNGLQVEVLWPLERQPIGNSSNRKSKGNLSDNDASCVVRFSRGQWSILLTGDIEKRAERKILKHYRNQLSRLKSNILIAPHHGSKTSSTAEFIEAVNPDVVIFSQGFNNRWGLPHSEVVERYQEFNQDVMIYTTSESGQISILLDDEMHIKEYREDIYPYWYANTRMPF